MSRGKELLNNMSANTQWLSVQWVTKVIFILGIYPSVMANTDETKKLQIKIRLWLSPRFEGHKNMNFIDITRGFRSLIL